MIGRVLTLGGHDFTSRPGDRAVSELMLRLAGVRAAGLPRAERSAGRPRICILPTASGDTSELIGRFYSVFGERVCEPSDVSLFRLGTRPVTLRDHLLAQDLIYVGGGSLLNLMAVWEAHSLGEILALAWRRGVVLAGQSAGAMCWFEAGITKSSGRPLPGAGLGLLPGSLCVHYNDEPERRAAYLDAVAGGMPGGYGLDDYAGLIWEGRGPPSAVTAQRGARAYRVARVGAGAEGGAGAGTGGSAEGVARTGGSAEGVAGPGAEVVESPLPARFLPAPAPAALREDIAEFRRITAMRKKAGRLA